MKSMDKLSSTLLGLSAQIAEGRCSSLELTEEAYSRIADTKGEGKRAFIRLFKETAIATAKAWDTLRAAKFPPPPLAGIPISVKDLFDVAGSTTTAGSVVLKRNPPAAADAPVVARLRAAGAVIIGATNMTEFAMGGLGINPHYGTPLNPFDRATGRIPGGSSSGGAVSVADAMVVGAIGTDTAGSVQMPAALCGLVGFKPTARRVPQAGSIPLAPSADSIGPIARSVQCCALLDSIISADGSSAPRAIAPSRLRIAVAQTLVQDDMEPAVAQAFSHALAALSKAGVQIVEIPLKELAEIPQAMARFGFSVVEGYAWHRELLSAHRDEYDPFVAARFEKGALISAADYIDLLKNRADLIRRCATLTRDFDAIAMPTVQFVAPPLAALQSDEQLWLATSLRIIRNPGVANFLDRCAITLPCHDTGCAPVGLSLVGNAMDDRHLLAVATAVETVLQQSR